MKESDLMKWLTVVLLFVTIYQCHELRELRNDVDRVDDNAIGALNRTVRVATDLDYLEQRLRRRGTLP